ncbi:MAG: primosomal protein N' [bacterium]
MQLPYAEIHFPLPLSRGYTYRVPESLNEIAQPGHRALVPLGKRVATGFIVRRTGTIDFPPEKLKDIFDVLDDESLFDPSRLQLAQWLAEYYLASLGEVLRTMLPPGLEQQSKHFVRLAHELTAAELAGLRRRAPRQAEIVEALQGKAGYKISYLAKHLGYQGVRASLRALSRNGIVEISQKMVGGEARALLVTFVRLSPAGGQFLQNAKRGEAKAQSVWRLAHGEGPMGGGAGEETNPSGIRLSHKQKLGLEILKRKGEMSRAAFLRMSGLPAGALQSLAGKALVELQKKEMVRNPYAGAIEPAQALRLNEAQSRAVAEIRAASGQHKFFVFLLYGITGSGKTQVYIEAIRHTLASGGGAIVLVPEISLTPQTVARFRSNFGENVAVLHSRLSKGERYDAWRRVQRGEVKLVIGPRSAVFAPVHDLGLIVVDEEHESSYKQVDPAPRYHARDAAIMRAKMGNAVVVLGSATPALESYHNALTGKYRLLELPRRIDDVPLPAVRILDMMRFRKTAPDHEGVFSRLLFEKIQEKLARKEQIIILQNRRGFAPMVRCVNCGFTRLCDACNIPLTYHKRGRVLRCHYCNAYEKAPEVCPQCRSLDLIFKGIGTQKVEEVLRELLPEARVVRMDLDTTRGKLAHDRILREFGEHRHDILLGTQMIAKGLDFHRVTLVGVISADTTLLRPDFRASERTFQLLTQVSGRAGRRNLPGEVIIQSYSPTNFCLICTQQHDFNRFFTAEIQFRQLLKYPPFVRVAVVLFRHVNHEKVQGVATDFAAALRRAKAPITVYGPIPAMLKRLQNEFRWLIVIKSDPAQDPGATRMRQTVAQTLASINKSHGRQRVRVSVDIDPVAVL